MSDSVSSVHETETYCANKALPAPFPSECFYSAHAISDAPFTRLAFGHTKPHMANFTVRVTLVHRKRDIVVLELAIPIDIELARARCVPRGREERISTLGAKEMLFVVCPLPKRRIIEGNESLVDDGGFTLEASRGELLIALLFSLGEVT